MKHFPLTVQIVLHVSRRGWDRGLTRLKWKEHKIQFKLLNMHFYSHFSCEKLTVIFTAKEKQEKIEKIEKFLPNNDFSRATR